MIVTILITIDLYGVSYWNGDIYQVDIPGGNNNNYLKIAKYALFIPKGLTKVNGILIHQHGCAMEGTGEPVVEDAQYQAFAKKWGLAILAPDLYPNTGKNCYDWVNPADGSAGSLQVGLASLSVISKHSELVNAPWLIWGHSGGAHWALSMTTLYPQKIIAVFAYSPAFNYNLNYPAAALKIPIMIRHAGAYDYNGPGGDCWNTALNNFSRLRQMNGLVSIAYTPNQNHNYSFVRYMAIPFFESVLKQRLPNDGTYTLKEMNQNLAYLVDTTTTSEPKIYKASELQNEKLSKSWLPDSMCAIKFKEFVTTGTLKDKTEPNAPENLSIETLSNGALSVKWESDADIESGTKFFNIYKNYELIGSYPENKMFQSFDTNGDNPIPKEQPILKYEIPENKTFGALTIGVTSVNHAGLESPLTQLTLEYKKNNIQSEFYISKNGSDLNPGTYELPFASLIKARNEIRKINRNMTGDIIVYLMKGRYDIDSTFELLSEDSGTNGFNIIYQYFNCEKSIISGGVKIENWSLFDDKNYIYRAFVGKNVDSRQLYVNDKRAVRARSADSAGLKESGDGYNTLEDFSNWKNPSNIEVVSRKLWKCHRGPVVSINGKHIKMANPYWENLHIQYDAPAAWIENAYELLDSEGEWYLNKSYGYLYYKPIKGEDILTSEIILPKLEKLIYGKNVTNVVFKGLTFSYATWNTPSTNAGFPCVQADVVYKDTLWGQKQIPGNIIFENCRNLVFNGNTFEHLGVTALQLYIGCKNNRVFNNIFRDISASAISLGGIVNFNPSDEDLVKNNIIDNNLITDIAKEYESSVGVFAPFSENTTISHNELIKLPYTGISLGWGWSNKLLAGRNIDVSYNYIDSSVSILQDGGGIYTLSSMPGTRIHHNYIKNFRNGFGALYPDMGSSNFRWHHNVLENTICWLSLWSDVSENDTVDYNYFNINISVSTGKNCIVENNTFVADSKWPNEAKGIMDKAGRLETLAINSIKVLDQAINRLIKAGNEIKLEMILENKSDTTIKYQWYKNGLKIPGEISSIYRKMNSEFSDSGLYYCQITNQCCNTISLPIKVQITDNNTSIEDAKISQIIISPNPASDYIVIKNVILSEAKNPGFEIFNIFGEKNPSLTLPEGAGTGKVLPTGEDLGGVLKIDVSNLAPGVYFIKIGDRFEKFVKM